MRRIIALVSLVVVLGLVNWSIVAKEKHLAQGRIVYLELAPVDPRSLIQGDYMALRFRLANAVRKALPQNLMNRRHEVEAADGHVIVALDARRVATFKRLSDDQPLAGDEMRLRYRVRNGDVKFATNAFFFQEGHAHHYQTAQYGQFRVDTEGELLLVGMYDAHLKKLAPEATRQQHE